MSMLGYALGTVIGLAIYGLPIYGFHYFFVKLPNRRLEEELRRIEQEQKHSGIWWGAGEYEPRPPPKKRAMPPLSEKELADFEQYRRRAIARRVSTPLDRDIVVPD